MENDIISGTSSKLLSGYNNFALNGDSIVYPDTGAITETLKKIRMAVFPGFFNEISSSKSLDIWLQSLLEDIRIELTREIKKALPRQDDDRDAPLLRACEVSADLLDRLAYLQELLFKDAQAGFNGDPAARSMREVILTYPGFYAVFVHRIAHYLFTQDVPIIPRIMSEHAHSLTGIDIHPGAAIGESFFIDHGTGIVIGETAVIGNHVKLYQGVTLGALSTRSGQKLAGLKRHPTIEDNVTIYSGATILGGETVIGKDSTIGGNVFIIKSIPEGSKVKGI